MYIWLSQLYEVNTNLDYHIEVKFSALAVRGILGSLSWNNSQSKYHSIFRKNGDLLSGISSLSKFKSWAEEVLLKQSLQNWKHKMRCRCHREHPTWARSSEPGTRKHQPTAVQYGRCSTAEWYSLAFHVTPYSLVKHKKNAIRLIYPGASVNYYSVTTTTTNTCNTTT